jgi:hypothetical protein
LYQIRKSKFYKENISLIPISRFLPPLQEVIEYTNIELFYIFREGNSIKIRYNKNGELYEDWIAYYSDREIKAIRKILCSKGIKEQDNDEEILFESKAKDGDIQIPLSDFWFILPLLLLFFSSLLLSGALYKNSNCFCFQYFWTSLFVLVVISIVFISSMFYVRRTTFYSDSILLFHLGEIFPKTGKRMFYTQIIKFEIDFNRRTIKLYCNPSKRTFLTSISITFEELRNNYDLYSIGYYKKEELLQIRKILLSKGIEEINVKVES